MIPQLVGAAIGALILVTPVKAAVEVPVWKTNFDNNVVFQQMGPFGYATATFTAGGAQFTNSQNLPGFGTRYLRNATAGTTKFEFTGLDKHQKLQLDFDFAFLDSWDAPTSFWGPDYIFVTIADTTYQWSLPWPGELVGRGHFAQNSRWMDSVHRFSFRFAHSAPDFTFAIRAGGAGFQGGSDESWGIDNIRLVAVTGVPEPKAWALMIAGFGLVGAVSRQRSRRAIVSATA